jgi:WD40 repeat protein
MRPSNGPVTPPESPYKGLASFEDSPLDAMLFFGREHEREIITANLLAARLTVLYGPSGVGKSSLLRAGVAHQLLSLDRENVKSGRARELAVVVFSSWSGDVLAELRTAVESELFGELGSDREGNVSLADDLGAWTEELGIDLCLILDQAEEYFVYHGTHGNDRSFVRQFPELLQAGVRVNCLVALREESLAALDVFRGKIPNLLANRLRLEHLDHDAGRAAIVEPVRVYNELAGKGHGVDVEPALVEAVLGQVEAGAIAHGHSGRGRAAEASSGHAIEAPYLQLVMQRLWEVEQRSGSGLLALETLRGLGGAERIVEDHLERALSALTPSEQDAAAGMFRYLVTPSGTKIAHGRADLRKYANLSEPEVENVLRQLSSQRILRPVSGTDNGGQSYEIYHDVLADAVLAWRGRREAQRELDAARRDSERRRRRALAVAGVALFALAVMAAITVFALTQRSDARTAARRAHARELVSTALSELAADPQRSLRLALQAAGLERSGSVENALRQALTSSRERLVLRTGSPVTTASLDPAGKTVLVGSDDGDARLFDAHRGRLLHRLDAGRGPVTAASFGAGGALVATGTKNGDVRLWRASSGRLVRARRSGGAIGAVAFSPDGTRMLAASLDRTVRVWRVGDGSLALTLRPHELVEGASFGPGGSPILVTTQRAAWLFDARRGALLHRFAVQKKDRLLSASLSPDGHTLVTTSRSHTAWLWDAQTGRRAHGLRHRGNVTDAAFGPGGKLVATASTDEVARVWSVAAALTIAVLPGHTNQLVDVSFSPDGRWIVTAALDRTARIFDSSSGRQVAVLAGHRAALVDAAYADSGDRVVTASRDGTARIWDPGTDPELRLLNQQRSQVRAAVFSHDGRLAASAERDGTARIWRVRDWQLLKTVTHRAAVTSVSFNREATRVLTTSRDGTARVLRLGRPQQTVVLRHGAPILAGAFSPDGRLAVTGATDGKARIWRVADGRALRSLDGRGAVQSVEFSPDGRLVLTMSDDGTARLWETTHWTLAHQLGRAGPQGRGVAGASFSPDNRLVVVTRSTGKAATLWDVGSGKLLQTLRGHRRPLTFASFSPDSKLVVTTSRDRDARIWKVGRKRSLHVLEGHLTVVHQARFSPDGRWVVTAGPQSAGLWAARTGRLLFFLDGHRKPLSSASFSPNGKLVLTGGEDGMIRLYRCEVCAGIDGLVALAKRRLAVLAPESG